MAGLLSVPECSPLSRGIKRKRKKCLEKVQPCCELLARLLLLEGASQAGRLPPAIFVGNQWLTVTTCDVIKGRAILPLLLKVK